MHLLSLVLIIQNKTHSNTHRPSRHRYKLFGERETVNPALILFTKSSWNSKHSFNVKWKVAEE